MKPNSEDLIDRNVARLVRLWADPLGDERTARARRAFLETAAPALESPSHRRGGPIATAAGLLICALVYGSLFLAGSGRSSTGQTQDDSKIKALIQNLGDANIVRRDFSALDLMALGAKALPLLEEASKGQNVEIRVRARDVLDRMALGGKRGALEPAEHARELENNRAFAAILSDRINTLDAECSAKAARLLDLQRQFDVTKTQLAREKANNAIFVRQVEVQLAQIEELTKKLAELQKK
jgi:hypothetical protein